MEMETALKLKKKRQYMVHVPTAEERLNRRAGARSAGTAGLRSVVDLF